VQEPTLNGSVETVEKRNTVTVWDGKAYRMDTEKYLRDGNGSFSLAVRKSTEHTQDGPQASDNIAEYEIGPDGRLQLHSQTVNKTVTRADGTKEIESNIFGRNVPGTVDVGGSTKLKLQEQQLIERKPGPGDTVVETLAVRRPSISDAHALGSAHQISETICRGKCDQ
jgi:hypothetical protein